MAASAEVLSTGTRHPDPRGCDLPTCPVCADSMVAAEGSAFLPDNIISYLARCGRPDVTGVRRAGRLDQQQVHLLLRDRAMFDALRYDVHLPRPKGDRSISQLNIEHAFQDEKKIIRVIVFVPDKFAIHFHDHDIAIVELGDGTGRPVLGKRRKPL